MRMAITEILPEYKRTRITAVSSDGNDMTFFVPTAQGEQYAVGEILEFHMGRNEISICRSDEHAGQSLEEIERMIRDEG